MPPPPSIIIVTLPGGETVAVFIEHFASRREFEEWLAAVGGSIRVRNVSLATRRAESPDGGTTYTVTYEATAKLRRRDGPKG